MLVKASAGVAALGEFQGFGDGARLNLNVFEFGRILGFVVLLHKGPKESRPCV